MKRISGIEIGDEVFVEHLENPRLAFMCEGYKGIVTAIEGEKAFVETDKLKIRQPVSFKKWLPLKSLMKLEQNSLGEI